MVKKKAGAATWKTLDISRDTLGDFFPAIEELTSYEVQGNKIIPKEQITRQKNIKGEKRKRKKRSNKPENCNEEPKLKKRKRDRRKRKKNKTKVTNKVNFKEVENSECTDKPLSDDESEMKELKSEDEKEVESVDENFIHNKMSAWNSFGIPVPILKALAEKGFTEPTEIQARTLPPAIMGRRDILGAAETGSGKTLAFGIPIITRILEDRTAEKNKIQEVEQDKDNEDEDNESSDDAINSIESNRDEDKGSDAEDDKSDVDVGSVAEDDKSDIDERSDADDDDKSDVDVDEGSDAEDDESDVYVDEGSDADDDKSDVDVDEGSDAEDDESDVDVDEGSDADDDKSDIDEGSDADVDVDEGSDAEDDKSDVDEDEGSDADEVKASDTDADIGSGDDDDDNTIQPDSQQRVNKIPSQEFHNDYNSEFYALVLTPTRELAIQVKNHISAAAKYTGIKVAVIVGGMSQQKQERILNCKPEIVVATPGRLWDLIKFGNSHLSQITNIRFLVIDETDRMLEKGHFQELQDLLNLLNTDDVKKRKRQNFVFSATLTMVHEAPRYQRKKFRVTPGQKLNSIMQNLGITNPKIIDVTKDTGMAGTITEAQIMCTLEDKDLYLYYFLQQYRGRTLIFCNSISCVRRLANLLNLLQCHPLPLHANMVQRQRLKNLDRFRDNPCGLLLATDVAARGLDIPGVQHVIHYQVPRTSESYVHRSGRTARAQNEGLTLLLIEPDELKYYSKLCQTLGKTNELPQFPVEYNILQIVKKRVNLARNIDRLDHSLNKSNSEADWFNKAVKDLDIIVDESDLPRKVNKQENGKQKKFLAFKKKELNAMLSKSLIGVFKSPSMFHASASERSAVTILKDAVDTKTTRKHKFNKVKWSNIK